MVSGAHAARVKVQVQAHAEASESSPGCGPAARPDEAGSLKPGGSQGGGNDSGYWI